MSAFSDFNQIVAENQCLIFFFVHQTKTDIKAAEAWCGSVTLGVNRAWDMRDGEPKMETDSRALREKMWSVGEDDGMAADEIEDLESRKKGGSL